MFGYLLLGSSFAFAAAVQPGPLQAFLLSSVARRGWKRTLPASFAPMISDGPIAFLAIFFLNHVPEILQRALQAGGGILLLVLAWGTFRQWRHQKTEPAGTDG